MTAPVPESFRVDVRPDRSRVVVTPVGELDIATVPALEAQASELRARGFDQLVIDLRELEFIDSTGLKLLLSLRTDGPLHLVDGEASGAVARLFDLAGIRAQFEWLAPNELAG